MMPTLRTLSDDDARAAYRAELERGHSGRKWHMRPAGEATAPARRLDPEVVRVRWRSDVLPGTERITSVAFSGLAADVEGLDGDPLEEEAPKRGRPGRPKGSGKAAPKDQASRERGHEANRRRAEERRGKGAGAAPEAPAAPEPPVEAAVSVRSVPVAADSQSVRAEEDGQLPLFGEAWWVWACSNVNPQSEEAAA